VERHGGLAVTRLAEDEQGATRGALHRGALGGIEDDVHERRGAPASAPRARREEVGHRRAIHHEGADRRKLPLWMGKRDN
jgi:hypothetical protein